MAKEKFLHKERQDVKTWGKVYLYPGGTIDILASDQPVFKPPGWEEDRPARKCRVSIPAENRLATAEPDPGEPEPDGPSEESMARAVRRARAKVRRMALANEFRWFVTLTLDEKRIDRYDSQIIVKRLCQWCSNQVKRRGLRYILVPERHKDGALHFHGFFSDALEAVPSGHKDKAGHMIYNFPGWTLGFTAGIELYGDYASAVGYVCKYIGKQGEKPAGRWYYSGGDLREPEVVYENLDWRELVEEYGEKAVVFSAGGKVFTVVNGVQKGWL